jgi:hypothetical protein
MTQSVYFRIRSPAKFHGLSHSLILGQMHFAKLGVLITSFMDLKIFRLCQEHQIMRYYLVVKKEILPLIRFWIFAKSLHLEKGLPVSRRLTEWRWPLKWGWTRPCHCGWAQRHDWCESIEWHNVVWTNSYFYVEGFCVIVFYACMMRINLNCNMLRAMVVIVLIGTLDTKHVLF